MPSSPDRHPGPLQVILGLWAALAFGASLHAPAAAQTYRCTGEITQTIRLEQQPPLRMPTDVAVDSAGRIVVADGVNDRVVIFTPEGNLATILDRTAGTPLAGPFGVDVTPDDAIWIADSGNRRIVRHAADAGESFPVRADLTDVLVTENGRVWFTDNDQHRVGWLDADHNPNWVAGNGALRYPIMLAATPTGDLLVSEAIAGQVQRLTPDGAPAGTVGRYGVDLGHFFRARAIAVAPDATLWISDARLGVIQVFTETGRFLDVLRDPTGQPLRLAAPTGLAFAPDGTLIAVELAADQVVRIKIVTRPEVPAIGVAPVVDHAQRRNCTACHLEWMAPLADGRGTPLIDPLPNPPEYPAASRSATCLSCHDGSVVDSRRSVWFGHGHQRGQEIPADFEVPAHLPLVGGEIACRTCHSAHTRGGAGDTIAEAVFLRVENHAGELCLACHADQASGPGMHPLAKLDESRRAQLDPHGLDGAHGMTCLACHQGHGGAELLLRGIGNRGSDECRTCHDSSAAVGHPLGGSLSPAQRDWVLQAGGQIGLDGELVCASCHQMHGGHGLDSLLLAQPATADACRGCHTDQAQVLGSAHDLVAAHADWTPDDRRPLMAAGACAACHAAHTDRPARTAPLDPTGACTDCHRPAGLAASHALTEWNHPEANCLDCHNPHQTSHAAFLRAQPASLCRECHSEVGTPTGGAHDLFQATSTWPDASQQTNDACLACHNPHGNAADGLFRAGLASGAPASDAACLACHPQSAASAAHRLLHPVPASTHGTLTGGGPAGQVLCRDCHDPHVGHRQTPALLRGPDDDVAGAAACLSCHTDLAGIRMIGHDGAALAASGFDAVGCAPCHQSHAGPSHAALRRADAFPSDQCVQCHSAGGPAAAPQIATHPEMDLVAAGGGDTALPLFASADGRQRIACTTCHLPHGRSDLAALPPELQPASHGHLRPFRGPNACTQCHGFEGLQRFLYFHDPLRRGGAGEQPDRTPPLWQPRAESVTRAP